MKGQRPQVPEIEPDDPIAKAGTEEIVRRLKMRFGTGIHALDRSNVEVAMDVVERYRVEFRHLYGKSFPKLVPLVLPSIGHFALQRADLPHEEIKKHLFHLITSLQKMGHRVEPVELAAAVRRAWPSYKGTEETHEKARKTIQ